MRHTGFTRPTGLLLSALICSTQPLFAEETKLHYDQVRLSAYASTEIENDIQTAVLYAQKEGSDPSRLSNQVNRLIAHAVAQAKQQKNIKVSTDNYQTTPRYHQQQLTGWRVRQSIRLESKDSQTMSTLLSSLQSGLALESISYKISTERRQAAEKRLTNQAIKRFLQRAEQITQQMGRNQYRLIEIDLQTIDQHPPPYRMRANMMAMDSTASAPVIEGGSQTLKVEISGRIELQLD
jgi:predicted secreted protein